MDLKDVVQNVKEKADEAYNAYHAGHQDITRKYLAGIRAEIVQFEQENPKPTGDVTESATTETLAGEQTSKQAEDQAEPAKPAESPGAQAAQAFGGSLTEPKQSQ